MFLVDGANLQCRGNVRGFAQQGVRRKAYALDFRRSSAMAGAVSRSLATGGGRPYSEAVDLRTQAFELAPAISGSIDGVAFEWLADADSRLGPVLEVIFNGRYYWIPFQQIQYIELEAPVDLRDVVWMPAQFTWVNGGTASGLIPTRYPGAENSEDP